MDKKEKAGEKQRLYCGEPSVRAWLGLHGGSEQIVSLFLSKVRLVADRGKRRVDGELGNGFDYI